MAIQKQSFSEKVATELIEQIKQGTAPWQKPWDGQDLEAPKNAITGKPYRGINNLWLSMMQPGDDNRWLTYKQATSIGAQVKKGEKGTSVEYWKFEEEYIKKDKDGKEVLDSNGKPIKIRTKLERPQVFYATVFNAGQCDNMPLRPVIEAIKHEWEVHKRAENILGNSGAVIEHERGNRAFYRKSEDKIVLPEKSQFSTDGGYYGTALHELGHWTGHESRLNRDMDHPFGSEGYAKEELRAEIASLMLSQSLSIPFDPGHHAAYVESWVKVLEDDPREIFRAASDAEKIKEFVMAFDLMQEQKIESTQDLNQKVDDFYQRLESSVFLETQLDQVISQISTGQILGMVNDEKEQITLEALQNLEDIVSHLLPISETNPVWKDRDFDENNRVNFENIVYESISELKVLIHEQKNLQKQNEEILRVEAFATEKQHVENAFNKMLQNGDVPGLVDVQQLMEISIPNSIQKIESAMLNMMPFDAEHNAYWNRHDLPKKEDLPAFIKKHSEGMIAIGEAKEELRLIREEEAVILQLVLDNTLNDEIANLSVIGDQQGIENISIIVQRFEPKNSDNAFWGRHGIPSEVGQILLDKASSKLAQVMTDTDSQNEKIEEFTFPLAVDSVDKQYFYAPYSDRKEVRDAGGEWDKEEKSWFIPSGSESSNFEKWLNSPIQQAADNTPNYVDEKIYIDVPYAERNSVKELGAKWDKNNKSWYVPEGVNIELFNKWIDKTGTEKSEHIEIQKTAVNIEIDVEDVANKVLSKPKSEENNSQIFLAVPFHEKNEAKEFGAKWDKDSKSWFTDKNNPNLDKLEKWLPKNQAVSDMGAISPQEEFANKMRELGLTVPQGHPIMDGQRQRVPTVDETGKSKSGSYKAYLDGKPAGSIENFKTGEKYNWKFEGISISQEEQAALKAEAAIKTKERLQEREEAYGVAANHAKEVFNKLGPTIEKLPPYLEKKGISIDSTIGMRVSENGLNVSIPIKNIAGEIQSLQSISADGTKYMLPGGKLDGGFHVINDKDLSKVNSIVIAEGVATAASLHESIQNEMFKNDVAVIAAFNSNNLVSVTQAIHEKYPEAKIIIAADDDLATEIKIGINPGKAKAQEAVSLCPDKAIMITPVFMPGEQNSNSKQFTDFNDLHTQSTGGIRAVRQLLVHAISESKSLSDGIQTSDIKILAAKISDTEAVDKTKIVEKEHKNSVNELPKKESLRGKNRV